MDVFNQTLNFTNCDTAATTLSTSGKCYTGLCDSANKYCSSSNCPPPWGTCSGTGCNQCSSTYNFVSLTGMTNSICLEICMVMNSFMYAATNHQ